MTRLKALELFGFKSFADRTRFEFPEGITVVVGPNGSGKSNVVDAIKWVLGEQSVRSLRGKEMTDVIFAGSTTRKPLNYAEVALVFDNTAGELPVRSPEVQIMRRVQRSGESEYLVNGETARLRDIRELFSGTGAATQAYSVIEQGRVDALLVASGKERRAVFEEAAGIGRFRARRTEALRRLERAELNRQRLDDIAGEVRGRLETVRHQAARARRWRQLTDRLRTLRLVAAARDLADVDAAVAAIEAERLAVREALTAAEGRAAEAAAEAECLAGRAAASQPRAAAARAALGSATRDAAAAEAALGMARTRRGDLEAAVATAGDDLRSALSAAHAARQAALDAEAAVAAIADRIEAIEARLTECERSAHGSYDEATDHERRLAVAQAALEEARERGLRLEAARERTAERADEARLAVEQARERLAASRGHEARLHEARAGCEGAVASLEHAVRQASGEVSSLEANQRTAQDALQAAWRDLADRRATLEACRERATVLRELVERQEGLSAATRRVLDGQEGEVPGIVGAVADLLVADEPWAGLVDIAIGTLAEALLVSSLPAVVGWHAEHRAAANPVSGGLVRLVDPGTAAPQNAEFDLEGRPGVIGRLDRLIAAAPAAGTALPAPASGAAEDRLRTALLGRVWVVEAATHALPLLPEAPSGTRFLTREGACVSADGTFEFGSRSGAEGLVARRSELRTLARREEECLAAQHAGQHTVDLLQARIDELRAAIRDAQARRARAAEAIATARHELERTARECTAAVTATALAEEHLRDTEQRAAAATTALRAAEAGADEATPAVLAARAEVEAAEAALRSLTRTRDAIGDEMQRLRIEQATCAEKLARSQETRSARGTTAATAEADVLTARTALAATRDTLLRHDLQLLAATGTHATATLELEAAARAVDGLERDAAAIDEHRRAAAAAIESARTEAVRLAEEAHRHDMEAGEVRHRRTRIVERIRDEYDIDIEAEIPAAPPGDTTPEEAADAAPVPEDRAELDGEIEEVRRKLGSYVSVNLDALQESESLAARLATLESQLGDVADAKHSIEQLIERIDEESRRRLGETLETVRAHFRELFERLFGGGQADIQLEEGVDLLDTAVDIVARPLGKEPRSISLLSGGEKTMTCVALLLAIFKSRPSPFCVLDEVDAALDEANVDRFSGVLRDFLSATQFIVVTHSKKTMAAATTLYGVTMEESGVSKRISVRFESAVAAARAA